MAASQNKALTKKGFSLRGSIANRSKGFERLSNNIAAQMKIFENGIDQAIKTVEVTQQEKDVLRDEYGSLLKIIRQDPADHISIIEPEEERDFTKREELLILQAKATEEKAHEELKKLCLAMRTVVAFKRPLPPEDTFRLCQLAPEGFSGATQI